MNDTTVYKRPPGRPRKTPEEKAKTKELAAQRREERERNGVPSKFGQEYVEAGDNAKYLEIGRAHV